MGSHQLWRGDILLARHRLLPPSRGGIENLSFSLKKIKMLIEFNNGLRILDIETKDEIFKSFVALPVTPIEVNWRAGIYYI